MSANIAAPLTPTELEGVQSMPADDVITHLAAIFETRPPITPTQPAEPAGRRGPGRPPGSPNVRVRSDNTSGHSGVAWISRLGKWSAEVCHGGQRHLLGLFSTIEEAVAARKAALNGAVIPDKSTRLYSHNTSGMSGVHWNKKNQNWMANITRGGRRYYLGSFATKEEASAAYQNAALNGVLPEKSTLHVRDAPRYRWVSYQNIKHNPKLIGWTTLEELIDELGEPPTDKHVLMRKDSRKPLGRGNAMWRLPVSVPVAKCRRTITSASAWGGTTIGKCSPNNAVAARSASGRNGKPLTGKSKNWRSITITKPVRCAVFCAELAIRCWGLLRTILGYCESPRII
jgi:hypothetical protein